MHGPSSTILIGLLCSYFVQILQSDEIMLELNRKQNTGSEKLPVPLAKSFPAFSLYIANY